MGGLGWLAVCFMDSSGCSLVIPAMGYGLRHEYGIFRQEIQNGYQIDVRTAGLVPIPDPWEVARPREAVQGVTH